ncbi:MAG: hypothetical protein RL156_1726 [Bacteroidota bacterium]|jgi:hypothetical protein
MSEDKWDKIEPAGRGKRGLSGGSEGAEKKKSSEAKRLTRRQIQETRQTLKEMSPDQMLHVVGVSKSTLTPKQRAYAYNVAMGHTGADAYRKAYNCTGKPKTIGDHASRLKRDARIQAEIEAYQLANEAAKHRTPEQLRNLVIQTLVQQVIDPETPPAIRTQAVKTLGQVTEVAAFTERKESIVHHSSDALRTKIMGELQALMSGKTIDGERIEQDASSLLAELSAPQDTPGTASTDSTNAK